MVRVGDGASQRVVLGGAHDLGEGVEAALLGMKAGEVCEVVASGEFGSGRCCVALDDIERLRPRPTLMGRGASLFKAARAGWLSLTGTSGGAPRPSFPGRSARSRGEFGFTESGR